MSELIYSYKCRAENFSDIAEFYVKIYEYVDEEIKILNTIIVDEKDAFVWEFDSDRTLEELVDMFKTIRVRVFIETCFEHNTLYETINYRAVYNDECIR